MPDSALLSVSYRVGSRHPVTRGAAGLAIASLRPETPDDPPAVRQAREDGYSVTRGQLQPGAVPQIHVGQTKVKGVIAERFLGGVERLGG